MAKGFRAGQNYSKTVTITRGGWIENVWKKYGLKARNEVLETIAHADQGNWTIRQEGTHHDN
jgi:hypothetical protein